MSTIILRALKICHLRPEGNSSEQKDVWSGTWERAVLMRTRPGHTPLHLNICEWRSLMGSYNIAFSFNIATDTEGPFEKADKARAGLAPGWA